MSRIKTKFLEDNAVTNAKLATVATATFKGRTTSGTGNVEDLTATQATALLNAVVGDSGSGGTKGLVPAPAAGDAAANKFLKADGTWATTGGVGNWSSSLTYTANNFGTTSSFNAFSRIVGDTLEARMTFNTGSVASSAASISMPSGYTITSSKLPSNSSGTVVGTWYASGGSTNTFGAAGSFGPIFYDGSDTSKVYFANQFTTTGLVKANGNSAGYTSGQMTLEFSVPVS